MHKDNISTLTSEISSLYDDLSYTKDLSQLNAKALLRELSASEEDIKWSYNSAQIIKNISLASYDVRKISLTAPELTEEVRNYSYDLARAWESLSYLQENVSRETAILNSAICYELAGYQANSVCLMKKIYRREFDDRPDLPSITINFLLRRFVRTKLLCQKLQGAHIEKELNIQTLALGYVSMACNQGSDYFLTGNIESYGKCLELLSKSLDLYNISNSISESNLVHGIMSLLPVMKLKSTWNYFKSKDVPEGWDKYLRLLARGLGSNILNSPSISELWPSQLNALESDLLGQKTKIVKMPTSAGKTRIAELAMIYELLKETNSKCVYVAPYRALVGELENNFFDLFSDLGFRVSSIIDYRYLMDDFEKLLADDSDVLVITPEKLEILYRTKRDFLKKVSLFILDEGHIFNETDRGLKFELLINRLQRKLTNARFLLLSAVIPKQTLEDFADWFNIKHRDIVTTNWRPSIQRISIFTWVGDNGRLTYADGNKTEFVHGLIKKNIYEKISRGKIKPEIFPDGINKSQTAAELSWKFAEGGSVLVFCSQKNFVRYVGNALLTRLDKAKIGQQSIPHYFFPHDTLSIPLAKEWLGNRHIVTRCLSNGIGIHYGTLPEIVKRAIENDFRNKKFNIMISTNTLAQGVNLPIRTVIVHSCWRQLEKGGDRERIPARDYWNICGRAGRAGEETLGLAIHICHGPSDVRDFENYYSRRENVEAINSALLVLFKDLAEQRISDEKFSNKLDSEIMQLLAEEGRELFSEENIMDLLDKTLAKVQLKDVDIDIKIKSLIQRKLIEIAGKIIKNTKEELWVTYSGTGLSSSSCINITKYVEENRDSIFSLLKYSNSYDEPIQRMIAFLQKGLKELSDQPETNLNYDELLSEWIQGKDISEISERFDSKNNEDISSFIEDNFSNNLPWAISGFIQIAAKILDIDDTQISDYVKFLPSIIKYGVPNQVASWAIVLGLPFRRIAINISSKYLRENKLPNYKTFVEYVSRLTTGDLEHEYHLKTPLLEEAAKTLNRTTTIKEFITTRLPYQTWIVAIKYGFKDNARQVKLGDSLVMEREYNNVADRNAIKIFLGPKAIGYLNRHIAKILAPELDIGKRFLTNVIQVISKDIPQIRIAVTMDRHK